MAQIEAPATEGFTELAKLLAFGHSAEAGHLASAITNITCCKVNTNAKLSLATCNYTDVMTDEATAAHGFTIAAGTVSRVGAVSSITHQFTAAGGGDSIVGFAVINDPTDVGGTDTVYGSCLYNAALDLTTNGDKVTNTMDITVKVG